ncbi:MAG: DUF3105 domain-containing protein [Solirubrobacteraceae bacterium]
MIGPSTTSTGRGRGRALRVLERIAIVLASLTISIGLIVVLSGYFTARDPADVSGSADGPGRVFADLGNAQLRPGQPRPAYDSDPPTSGAHFDEPVTGDEAQLNDDQLLQALAVGDVVFMYAGRTPPPGLETLARGIAGPFTPALASAGQAVILARRPGIVGVLGLAWTHTIYVSAPDDPALAQFAQFWLGRGAPAR